MPTQKLKPSGTPRPAKANLGEPRATNVPRARRGAPGAKPRGSAPAEAEVYERIYDAVLSHRLVPGTKLKEVALAEAFGVNRNVIRKVLTRLSYDKLILLRPNRGAMVASPSIEESRDLFSARRAVEGAIVDRVSRTITAADVKRLRAIAAEENDAYRRGDMRKGLRLSLQFHRVLAGVAGNGVLSEFLDQLIARTPLVVLAYRGRSEDTACSIDEHSSIIDAIAAGDAVKAVAAMDAHLQSLEAQLDLTKKDEDPADLAALFELERV